MLAQRDRVYHPWPWKGGCAMVQQSRSPDENKQIVQRFVEEGWNQGNLNKVSELLAALCANMSETSSPSTITVGRGKNSHFDKHGQGKYFFRCVGSLGA